MDEQENFKMILPSTGNLSRIKAFENYTEKNKVSITCIFGPKGTGKSLLIEDMLCNDPIILDEAAQRYYMYPDLNPLNDNDNHDIELAIRMAREAYYFAEQGKNVIICAENADKSYEYLTNTLEEIRAKKIHLRNKYTQGVDICLRLIETHNIKTYNK